jgi:hypothetical protein
MSGACAGLTDDVGCPRGDGCSSVPLFILASLFETGLDGDGDGDAGDIARCSSLPFCV